MASHSAARHAARAASSPAARAWRTASAASSSRLRSGRTSEEAIESRAVTSAVSAVCPSDGRWAPRPAAIRLVEREPGLFEQADLLAVEQLDLESGGPAAQAKGRPGEQVGPPGPAGPFGCLPEPGPAAVRVAGRQPGRAQVERGGRLVGVAGPAAARPADVLDTSAPRPRRPARPWPGRPRGGRTRWPARPRPGLPGPGGRRPRRRPRPGRARPGRPARRRPGRAVPRGQARGSRRRWRRGPSRAGTGPHRARGLEEAGVAAGGERAGQLSRRHSGQRGQHVPPEARAQNRGGLEYRTGGSGQFGQPRAGDDPDGVGDHRAGRAASRRPWRRELAGQLGGQERIAAAALGDDLGQAGLGRLPGHVGHQVGHVGLAERRQRDDQAGPQQRAALRPAGPARPGRHRAR